MQECHRSTYNLNYSKIWSKKFIKPACFCTNISTLHRTRSRAAAKVGNVALAALRPLFRRYFQLPQQEALSALIFRFSPQQSETMPMRSMVGAVTPS